MNMIEKVALAVWERTGIKISKESSKHIIEAMREPTVFMLDTMDAIDTRELAKDMWQAGIDAALKEE